jgi:hypothetical protein
MNDQANADSAGSVDPGNGQMTDNANGDAPTGPASTGADRVPVSLATQKLRLAVTMSGGVSLAVWMGGVAREVSLLTRPYSAWPTPDGWTSVPCGTCG